MNILDDLNAIKKLDASNMVGSIEQLGEQVEQTWNEVNAISFPETYRTANKIVFSGMGGSALGAYVAKYAYTNSLKVPYEVINDYHLPGYVDDKTLVVVGSYSGTTEETLSCFQEALSKGAMIACIAAGGQLEVLSREHNLPFYKIDPKFNPCNQPRMGIGYSIFGFLTMLKKLGFIVIGDSDIAAIKSLLNQNNQKFGVAIAVINNPAKQLAQKLFNRLPVLIAGEFLVGATHAIRNQAHENAKSLTFDFPLPELNHHLLEAFPFPEVSHQADHYLFFESDLYSPKIAKRLQITRELTEKTGHQTSSFKATAKDPLAQILETINFGSYVGYYLALLNGIDPSPIVLVEEFKKKLAS